MSSCADGDECSRSVAFGLRRLYAAMVPVPDPAPEPSAPRYGLVVPPGTALGVSVAHGWSESGSVPPFAEIVPL